MAGGAITYLYGLNRISQTDAETSGYFLGDALNSVRQVVDPEAEIKLVRSYSPYGETSVSLGDYETDYSYTGEMSDQSGLVNLRARYYDPSTGRFVSRDTWSGNIYFPQSTNRWSYVEGSPTNFADPSGNIKEGKESKTATKILQELISIYNVDIYKDWGNLYIVNPYNPYSISKCNWEEGNWRNVRELELTLAGVQDIASKIGGPTKFKSAMKGVVKIRRYKTLGNSAGFTTDPVITHLLFGDLLLLDGAFNYGENFAKEVVVHELAHVWDLRGGLSLSSGLMIATHSYDEVCNNLSIGYFYCYKYYDPTKTKEEPPTKYARTNPAEDWAESVMVYVYPPSGNNYFGLKPIRQKYIEIAIRNIH